MESSSIHLASFFIVLLVSGFSVSIGVGGGVLYFSILSCLYKEVSKGVYLSKMSIMITSMIGVLYHFSMDVSAEIKKHIAKKSKTTEEEEQNSEYKPRKMAPPRFYLVFAMSLIPWFIIGSNVGTTFHFFAKEHLKYMLTAVVSLSILLAASKLYFIYRKKKQSVDGEDSQGMLELTLVKDPVDTEVATTETEKMNPFLRMFRPYNRVEVHSFGRRVTALIMIVVCLVAYYITAMYEELYIYLPIRSLIALTGLFYSIKVRKTFRKPNFYSQRKLPFIRTNGDQGIVQKMMTEGIQFIILNTVVGFIAGFLSGTLGIGAGVILLPVLQYLDIGPVSCWATTNLLTLVTAIATLSRFSFKITIGTKPILSVAFGSFVGTSLSLFLIRAFLKDKITGYFINITFIIFCILSILFTWTNRHLNEFLMIEAELSNATIEGMLEIVESLLTPQLPHSLVHNTFTLSSSSSKVKLVGVHTKLGNPLILETHPILDYTDDLHLELQKLMMRQRILN